MREWRHHFEPEPIDLTPCEPYIVEVKRGRTQSIGRVVAEGLSRVRVKWLQPEWYDGAVTRESLVSKWNIRRDPLLELGDI